MEQTRAISAVVRGRVLGVGFRYATVRLARSLGLVGWVRNTVDGSVEVAAHGPAAAIDELVAFLERGPAGAVVTAVDVRETEPTPEWDAFDLRL